MQNRFEVQIQEYAKNDLNIFFDYLLENSKEFYVVEKLYEKFQDAFLKLEYLHSSMPFSQFKRLRQKGYRKFLVGNYVILYRVSEHEKKVIVDRIFHTAQDYVKNI
ncbi:MAG: type II toxin-antitoxin system RelE/ParE family toxin [Clostridiales bacterium]|jgi:plasmid stabilization system protein ParE|nr:type II toxin-antitoxin system RelE/ParE family toxin [Clostridiales bacterium]